MPSSRPLFLALTLLLPASLPAHPDHTVTQKGVVEAVPSTQEPSTKNQVSITIEGDKRVITANGIPDHATGRFPNADNPNRITAQRYRYTIPLKPVPAARPVPLVRQPFGIALNGVVFDPGTAEAWQNKRDSGWSYDALGGAFSLGLDTNHGHVQPTGAYHYHGIPAALLARLSGDQARPTLVGWAADGFPIYAKWDLRDPQDKTSPVIAMRASYRLKKGERPTTNGQPGGTYDGVFVEDFEYVAGSGDLDECSGRFGPTPEFPEGVYHYVLTEDFPFIPRNVRATPDPSFASRGPPPGGGSGGPGA
ncbi:MAG: YHYH protein, partial [Burkholderiales bacterium]|nr:YHYH protein [Opitutaceae bacterium]